MVSNGIFSRRNNDIILLMFDIFFVNKKTNTAVHAQFTLFQVPFTENNYIIIGDSLETAITGMSLTQKEKEYITKIEIPISKTIPIT